jgi:pyridine nucleotide-disulfide oxidoreductase family protein
LTVAVHPPAGRRRVVLVGGGHAHALVLRDWARAPLAGVELVVVSPTALAPYSGMVPGWLAGHYRFRQICIDVEALARAAGARWVADELAAVDPAQRTLRLAGGAELAYDRLSLNVGSTLNPPVAAAGARLLPLRPLALLQRRWTRTLQAWRDDPGTQPFGVSAVGGGAAGVESLLAVLARLRAERPDRKVHGRLFHRGDRLLEGLAAGAARAATRALQRAGVGLQLGRTWGEADAAGDDLVLWATGAEAHAWQRDPRRRGELAVGERGFVRVDTMLRSVSHPEVFAAGDCAEWVDPLPKAGVYAVRMGPVLAANLRASLGHGAGRPYVPQRRFLVLLATGDRRAIAAWDGLSAAGRWAWRWKDRIDRGFLRGFEDARAAADMVHAGVDGAADAAAGGVDRRD